MASARARNSGGTRVAATAPALGVYAAAVAAAATRVAINQGMDMANAEPMLATLNSANAVHSRVRLGMRVVSVAITGARSEEHTSELQSLMRISYAVFCLKKKKNRTLK